MRLDKYLSHMGFGTRNDVKKLIKKQKKTKENVVPIHKLFIVVC